MTRIYFIVSVGLVAMMFGFAPVAQAKSKAEAREAYCAKKRVASEREICRDKDLTRRDATLNEVYQELRGKLKRRDFKALRKEQRAWLVERNRCGSRTRCLATKYEDRVAVLEQMLESLEHPGKSHVEIGCDGPGQTYSNGECIIQQGDGGSSDGAVWTASAFNDPANKGRFTAYLQFGVPETDDVSFHAVCSPGSSGTFVTTTIGYNTGTMEEGAEVKLKVSSGGSSRSLDGEVYGTTIEEGVSGVLVYPEIDDPIWDVLAGGGTLHYAVKGHEQASLSLKGGGKPVREFVANCKSIQTADDGGGGGGGDEPVLSAKNQTCDQFGTIKSKKSATSVTVTFVNKTDSHRAVMWINFEGMPVDYAALNAGESYTVKTYVTHPWMFTDGPGNCIEMYMPRAGDSTFEITADSPYFGPEHD